MKTMKRILALLMAMLMVFAMAACGNGGDNSSESSTSSENSTSSASDESSSSEDKSSADETGGDNGEIKTVAMWLPAPYDMPLAPKVQDAINAIAEERYGLHYELTFVNWGNYATQLNLALTSDEIDIFQAGGFYNYYKNGQLANLSDYYADNVDELGPIWNDMYMDCMKINGDIYGVPVIADFGHYLSLNLDQEVADKYNITSEQELTMDEIDELLEKIHTDFPDRYTIGAAGTTTTYSGFYTWDNMLDRVGVLPDKGQSTTVESIFDNKDYIDLAKRAEKWYQAGYIMPDILSNTQSWATMLANHQIASVFDTYGINFINGAVRTRVKEVGHWMEGMIVSNNVWSISANSKDPETAFYALTRFYTDKDMSEYLNNGIEGENYVQNEDGTISFIDGKSAADSGYGAPSLYWILPGAELSQPLDVNGPTFFEDLVEYNKEGDFSKITGFNFDYEAVTDEYTACKAVIDKYFGTIYSGAVDVDATLEQARAEMDAAGEDKVIAEKQRQIDEFLKNK